jgi:hypothetical protein
MGDFSVEPSRNLLLLEMGGLLRSYLTQAAHHVMTRATDHAKVQAALRTAQALKTGNILVDLPQLSAWVSRHPQVASVLLTSQPPALGIYAQSVDAQDYTEESSSGVAFQLTPQGTAFAARGAKEISFRISPAHEVRHPLVRALVGQLAGVVAYSLWGRWAATWDWGQASGIVDIDPQTGVTRVDLRSVRAMSPVQQHPLLAQLTDLVGLKGVHVSPAGLQLELDLAL